MRAASKAGWEAVAVEVGSAVTIPLLGTVAAGLPFQAFPVEGTLELPAGLWGGRTVFALRARGSSMIDEGIRDGDYLIVEPRETAEVGQTVVAEVDGGVTVKRLCRETDGRLRLQPANPDMLPLVVAPARAHRGRRRRGLSSAGIPQLRPGVSASGGRGR